MNSPSSPSRSVKSRSASPREPYNWPATPRKACGRGCNSVGAIGGFLTDVRKRASASSTSTPHRAFEVDEVAQGVSLNGSNSKNCTDSG